MVVVSHDREFLDQLCTKVVETERGVATTYGGNYTQYVAAKVRGRTGVWSIRVYRVYGGVCIAGVPKDIWAGCSVRTVCADGARAALQEQADPPPPSPSPGPPPPPL